MTDVVIPALTRDDQAAPRSSQAAGAAMKLLAIAEAFKAEAGVVQHHVLPESVRKDGYVSDGWSFPGLQLECHDSIQRRGRQYKLIGDLKSASAIFASPAPRSPAWDEFRTVYRRHNKPALGKG
jgi:hypothetical protein